MEGEGWIVEGEELGIKMDAGEKKALSVFIEHTRPFPEMSSFCRSFSHSPIYVISYTKTSLIRLKAN